MRIGITNNETVLKKVRINPEICKTRWGFNNFKPFDKAGAYGIQGYGALLVSKIDGDYYNVMGLPLCHVVRALHRLGVAVPNDVPTLCQAHIRYGCPVFENILASPAGRLRTNE